MALKVRYADGRIGEVNDPGEALEIYRHSTSHLMAAAVNSLLSRDAPGHRTCDQRRILLRLRARGRFRRGRSRQDRSRHEGAGRARIWSSSPPSYRRKRRSSTSRGNGEHLKVELIEEKAGQTLSCYQLGDLVDFCTGPHVLSTAQHRSGLLSSSEPGRLVLEGGRAPREAAADLWHRLPRLREAAEGLPAPTRGGEESATTASWGVSWISSASPRKRDRG